MQAAGQAGKRGHDSREASQRPDLRHDADTFQRQQQAQQHSQQQQMAAQRQMQAQHAQQRQLQARALALRDAAAVSAQDLIRSGPQRVAREREREEPPGVGRGDGREQRERIAKTSQEPGSARGDDGQGSTQMQVGTMSMQKLAALRAMAEAAEAGEGNWQGVPAEPEHLHAVSTGADHGPLSWPSGSAPLASPLQSQPNRSPYPGVLGRWWNKAKQQQQQQQPLGAASPSQPGAPQLPAHATLPPSQPAQLSGSAAVSADEPTSVAPSSGRETAPEAPAAAAAEGQDAAGSADRVSGADTPPTAVAKSFTGTVAEGVPVIQGGALARGGTVGVGVPVVATGVPITGADALHTDAAVAAVAAASDVVARGAAEPGGSIATEDDEAGETRTTKRMAENGVQSPSAKAAKVSSDKPPDA